MMNNTKHEQLLRGVAKPSMALPLILHEHALFTGFISDDEVIAAFVEDKLSVEQSTYLMKAMASSTRLREQWLALKSIYQASQSDLTTEQLSTKTQLSIKTELQGETKRFSKLSNDGGLNHAKSWLSLAASVLFVTVISIQVLEDDSLHANKGHTDKGHTNQERTGLVAKQHTKAKTASQSAVQPFIEKPIINSVTSTAQWQQFLLGAQSFSQKGETSKASSLSKESSLGNKSSLNIDSPAKITHYELGKASAKLLAMQCTPVAAANWYKKLIGLTPLTFDLDAYNIQVQETFSDIQVAQICQLAKSMMQTAKKSVKEAN